MDCVVACRTTGVFGYSNKVSMQCESSCPTPLLTVQQSSAAWYCDTTCPSGQYKFFNSCVQTQPASTYLANNQYLLCPLNCLTCTSSTLCQSCVSGYYLDGGNCALTCSSFLDMLTNACVVSCSSTQLTLNELIDSVQFKRCYTTNCQGVSGTTQFVNTYQSAANCKSTCDPGYYGNPANMNCDPCKTGCALCNNSSTYCTACNGIYAKDQTSYICVKNCP